MYGGFGNKFAPLGDDDIASSITLTGQALLKKSNKVIVDHIADVTGEDPIKCSDSIIYNDTDSLVYDSIVNINDKDIEIGKLWDNNAYEGIRSDKGHEVIEVDNLFCKSFSDNNKSVIEGKVKRLIRHKVSKKKYKITVDGNDLFMTEDHGCMVRRDDKLIRVSPKDIIRGDKMIIMLDK